MPAGVPRQWPWSRGRTEQTDGGKQLSPAVSGVGTWGQLDRSAPVRRFLLSSDA